MIGFSLVSVEVRILVPVVVSVAMLILIAVIIFGVIFMSCIVLSKKRGKLLLSCTMNATIAPFSDTLSESVECTINTGDNEAYSLVKRYQKTIDTQANPSYEKTSVKSMSDRCRSPQA